MITLTKVHVVISLIAIFSGLVVAFGMLTNQRLDRWTVLFLASTLATSLTGFLFPFNGVTPGIVVGIISIVVLAIAIFARYKAQLAGASRWLYVISAIVALYLNVFVLVAQLFQKVPALKALAPTQTEAPFAAAQLVTLILFVVIAVFATLRFRPAGLH
ncbi:MAG TPA: hypothetical protein VI306_12695 [Pyrinomonadaceae bacterium]